MAPGAAPDVTFDAVVLDRDDTADIRDRVAALTAAGVPVYVCAAGGSEVYRTDGHERLLVWRNSDGEATDGVTWALDAMAELGIRDGRVLVADGAEPAALVEVLDGQLVRRRDMRVPSIDRDPAWVVEIVDDHTLRRVNESLTALSNGTIGVRGGREEDGTGTTSLVIVDGVYAGRPVPRLLPGPVWPVLVVRDGESGPDRWLLDLRSGVLARERADAGGRTLRTLRFVSVADPTVMAIRAEGAASRLAPGDALRAPDPDSAFDREREGTVDVGVTRSNRGGGVTIATATRQSLADGRRQIERIAVHAGDNDNEPDTYEVRRRLERACSTGFDRLLADHRAAWETRWRHATVSIDGDPTAELAVRFSLFHVLSAAAEDGEAAVGARGLTGPAYAGHVFWDSDVFVLPVLAAVNPAAAKAMLRYRVRRLPAARRIAAAMGLPGVRFPWESADTGADVTPSSARDRDGRLIPIRTGWREEHINADIAWAACEYHAWTGDDAFLRAEGRDLVLETARFWVGRARFDADGRAHIYGVIGPDEYHEIVDDNAYTNVMVRWHLRRAARLAETGGGADPGEIATWRRLADALVDGYDPETGVYEQFAGYSKLEPLAIADFATPPVAGDLLLGAGRVRGSQLIKQADVLMLHHIVPDETAPGSLVPNADFYAPRTCHGSSLSPAIQAAALARAGRVDDALDLFRVACRLDLDDLTGTTAGGVHLATMGGVWQALAYGFAGVRPGEALAVDPALPPAWDAVELNFWFRGAAVRLRVDHETAAVTTDRPVRVLAGSERCPVDVRAGTTTIPLRRTP